MFGAQTHTNKGGAHTTLYNQKAHGILYIVDDDRRLLLLPFFNSRHFCCICNEDRIILYIERQHSIHAYNHATNYNYYIHSTYKIHKIFDPNRFDMRWVTPNIIRVWITLILRIHINWNVILMIIFYSKRKWLFLGRLLFFSSRFVSMLWCFFWICRCNKNKIVHHIIIVIK